MDARVEHALDGLRHRGFARLGGVVGASIVDRLRDSARVLRTGDAETWDGAAAWFAGGEWRPSYFAGDGKNAVLYDCLGLDSSLDAAVEDLVATPQIRVLLDTALGHDYRLWYAQLRWAEPGGEEYRLHQDVYGELGLCVYLSDHPDGAGSIVFWPGSHRWPRVIAEFPPVYPSLVMGRLAHVNGVAGDVCVFLNKTWHGRTSASAETRLVFLISFIPPGPIEKGRRIPDAARAGFGPQLRRVTERNAGRPFGAGPPTHPPFSSTFEGPLAPELDLGNEPRMSCIAELRLAALELSPEAAALVERVLADLVAPPAHSATEGST